jgi:S-adenosylmethionine decarboxylase
MIGTHVLLDLYGVAPEKLCDAELWRGLLRGMARSCQLTIVGGPFLHPFENGGLTGVVLLAESHIAFHTYPEFGYAALDAFSCGCGDVNHAVDAARQVLEPRQVILRSHRRGEQVLAEVPAHSPQAPQKPQVLEGAEEAR